MLFCAVLLALASQTAARSLSLVLLPNKEVIMRVKAQLTDRLRGLFFQRAQGAVCLDGSPPGYYIGKGSGSGYNKWILHQGGGGWCYSDQDCLERSETIYGSSTAWNSSVEIGGIFSNNKTINGQFYDWNVIYFMYCDGGSFSGYR